MKRLVVLISGRGSNMQAVVEACKAGLVDAEVVAVISNDRNAAGLDYAREQNIDARALDHKRFSNRIEFDSELQTIIDSYQPNWVLLAGFMRILNADMVEHYLGRMINIHPSLLPLHPGLNTHKKALAAGDKEHGASVHFVTPELDAGPIIAQSKITILPNDTEQSLAERVLLTEHELYVRALQLCVNGDARLIDGECYRDKPEIEAKVATMASNGQRT